MKQNLCDLHKRTGLKSCRCAYKEHEDIKQKECTIPECSCKSGCKFDPDEFERLANEVNKIKEKDCSCECPNNETIVSITPCPYIVLDSSSKHHLVIVSLEDLVEVQKKINELEAKIINLSK